MFTTNGSIRKMYRSRISERSCERCGGRVHGMNFYCSKCGAEYCLSCGVELGRCPKCGGRLE